MLAMSVFLLGAVGFGVDGSRLYAERQMAQAAADAAAQSGIMSIFDGTSGAWGTHTAGSAFTCSASDSATPCYYAQTMDGFNGTSDTVTVTPNPAGVTVPNLSPTTVDPVHLLQVTVQRQVPTTLMQLLGPAASTIKATATAAILAQSEPVPIIITDPIGSNSLSMNGTTGIKICGGPQRSIQINSSSSSAYTGGGTVDLSHAGPLDTFGNCTSGTGGDFGVFGGDATNPGSVSLGSAPGHYLSPSSPIQDPLASVAAPGAPTTTPPQSGQSCSVLGHCSSCPGGAKTCTEYLPGLYNSGSGINVKGSTAMFDPGVYYIKDGGGFTLKTSTVGMCSVPSSCSADPTTGSGMLIYDTGPKSGSCNASGGFGISTNVTASLLGADLSSASPPGAPAAPYYGILFFEDRNACAQTHTLGQGNGCFDLIGTIYITNTLAQMKAGVDQTVDYHGTPCSGTINQGEIIVSDLSMQGNSQINMDLYPTGVLNIRQVALVN